MCLDIRIPSSSKSVTKRYSVEERVGDVLQPFAIRYPKYFDETDGLSEEELVLSTQEEIEPAEYGRITKDPPRRNIKKRRTRQRKTISKQKRRVTLMCYSP